VSDMARLRLANQQITVHPHTSASDVVTAFGAMQAQDYRNALWAVGLRLHKATASDIELALASSTLVRTWALRGTLHLVAAQDVRWVLDLVAPSVIAQSTGRLRQLGIDDIALRASRAVLEQALSDGGRLTRADALALLDRAGIETTGQRGIHILRQLSLKGLLVQTVEVGRQTTFALLDAVVPRAPALSREEALAELAWRYFSSHGPATVRDFAWWSGLPAAEARAGTELAASRLAGERIGDAVHWMPVSPSAPPSIERVAWVLPAFDEYILGYAERRVALDPVACARIVANGLFPPPSCAPVAPSAPGGPAMGRRPRPLRSFLVGR